MSFPQGARRRPEDNLWVESERLGIQLNKEKKAQNSHNVSY
jgi:hypothetical protein